MEGRVFFLIGVIEITFTRVLCRCSLKVRSAVVKSAYCLTEHAICSLVCRTHRPEKSVENRTYIHLCIEVMDLKNVGFKVGGDLVQLPEGKNSMVCVVNTVMSFRFCRIRADEFLGMLCNRTP